MSDKEKKPYGVEFFQNLDDAQLFHDMLYKRGIDVALHELSGDEAKEFAPFVVTFNMEVAEFLDFLGVVGEAREMILKQCS